MTAPARLSDEQLRELQLQAYLEVLQEAQQRGAVPRANHTVLARLRWLFEYAGALVLGLLVASSTMLVVFFVTRVILHVDFSRYASL